MIIWLSPANSQCEFAPNSQYCEFQAEFGANSRCERIRSEFGEFKLNSLRICIPNPKKRPQGENATPEGNNSKKRRLAWMAKSLIAAGVDVKLPDEE